MDIITVVNLVFSLSIVYLGIRRYMSSGVKAFLFVGLGFFMYAISHFSLLMGWASTLKTLLVVVRSIGYILVIIGLLL